MNFVFVAAVTLICCFFSVLLRQTHPDFAFLLTLSGAIILLTSAMAPAREILDAVRTLGDGAGVAQDALSLLLQGCAILLLTRICGDLCEDTGQRSLSSAVQFCGRVALAALAVPSVLRIAEMAENVLL